MVSKEQKQWLYNTFNATSTGDGQGSIETYENWLERQLLSRIDRLKELEEDDKEFLLEHVFEKMDVIAHFECLNPPTKYVHTAKRKLLTDEHGELVLKDGKPQLKTSTHYLTANLFYSGNVHWSMMRTITNMAKDYILPMLHTIPKMEKCRIELTYHHPNAQYDLDNKLYFWCKILLDLFTPPTEKELKKAEKYKYHLKTIDVLEDDSVKFIDGIIFKHKKEVHTNLK